MIDPFSGRVRDELAIGRSSPQYGLGMVREPLCKFLHSKFHFDPGVDRVRSDGLGHRHERTMRMQWGVGGMMWYYSMRLRRLLSFLGDGRWGEEDIVDQ